MPGGPHRTLDISVSRERSRRRVFRRWLGPSSSGNSATFARPYVRLTPTPLRHLNQSRAPTSPLAFISHSTQDGPLVLHEVDGILRAAGLDAFIAHRDIPPSRAWRDEIKRNLASCRVFVALLTDAYHESEWCDQEFGFVLARPEVVVIPINVTAQSYGFLSDHQELRWKTGRYVRSTENGVKLVSCLLDREVVGRLDLVRGLGVAPNFRSADVVLEILGGLLDASPLSQAEAGVLTNSILSNDQVSRNTNAPPLLTPQLARHLHSLPPETCRALVRLGFAAARVP